MRTTEDPKENIIRVRINADMMTYLRARSTANRESISEYVRDVIQRDMNSKCRDNRD